MMEDKFVHLVEPGRLHFAAGPTYCSCPFPERHCWPLAEDIPEETMRRMKEITEWAVRHGINLRLKYLEEMAAAFLMRTDIPIEEVVLVEETSGYDIQGSRTVLYYARKSDIEVQRDL